MIFLAHYLPHSAENDEIIAALEKIVDFQIVLKPFKIAKKKARIYFFTHENTIQKQLPSKLSK